MELDSGSVGRFTHPYVEVLSLTCFEKQDVIAIVELGELVQLVEFGLSVEFGIFTAMGKKGVEVIE